ncbi:hypothetical protein AGMMS49574_04750 [Bacteroidia bacterium]|nr:hypothetical protein AGMMS49574_04750 [Bacteroidia bacterium]
MKKQNIYSKRTNLVLGFHGCDLSVAKKVIEGGDLIETKEERETGINPVSPNKHNS